MMKKPALFVLAAVASLAPLASCEGGEIHTAWAIGVDVDQGPQNEHVLTSAMKLLSTAVPNALDGVLGDFNGGVSLTLGAKEDAVGLPDAESSWRFENFKMEQYEAIYAQVRDGEITIPSSTTAASSFMGWAESTFSCRLTVRAMLGLTSSDITEATAWLIW